MNRDDGAELKRISDISDQISGGEQAATSDQRPGGKRKAYHRGSRHQKTEDTEKSKAVKECKSERVKE